MAAMKKDKLDAMIILSAHVLAEKNVSELMLADHADIKMPESVERQIKHMIHKEHNKFEYGIIFKYLKRTAIIFLIICTTAFAFIMSIEAVRSTIWDTLLQWYENFISVTYVGTETPPEYIEEKRELLNIPDAWDMSVKLDSDSIYYIQYLRNDGRIMSFKQKTLGDEEDWIDNEEAEIENIMIGSNHGYLIKLLNKNRCCLVWNDGKYSYTIDYVISEIDLDLVMSIAESLQ